MLRNATASLGLVAALTGTAAEAASHREAPLTAIDRTADITDWYAFVSPDAPDTVTMILAVDPLLEPANGPNYFPFDDNLLYALRVDNDQDARRRRGLRGPLPDRDPRLPDVPVGFIGAGSGVRRTGQLAAAGRPGTPLIPPAITALDGRARRASACARPTRSRWCAAASAPSLQDADGTAAVRGAEQCRAAHHAQTTRACSSRASTRSSSGVKVFAGTTDDAFYIDLGAAFDSLNFRRRPGRARPASRRCCPTRRTGAKVNFVADDVSGYNVNTIAIEVPIALLTRDGSRPGARVRARRTSAPTAPPRGRAHRARATRCKPIAGIGGWVQVQRMGNPLINELIIGTGFKDRWSWTTRATTGSSRPSPSTR